MAQTLEFEHLLQSASPGDIGDLEKELDELTAEEEALQERLSKLRKSIHEVQGKPDAPVRSAIRRASELAIEIPEEYQ